MGEELCLRGFWSMWRMPVVEDPVPLDAGRIFCHSALLFAAIPYAFYIDTGETRRDGSTALVYRRRRIRVRKAAPGRPTLASTGKCGIESRAARA